MSIASSRPPVVPDTLTTFQDCENLRLENVASVSNTDTPDKVIISIRSNIHLLECALHSGNSDVVNKIATELYDTIVANPTKLSDSYILWKRTKHEMRVNKDRLIAGRNQLGNLLVVCKQLLDKINGYRVAAANGKSLTVDTTENRKYLITIKNCIAILDAILYAYDADIGLNGEGVPLGSLEDLAKDIHSKLMVLYRTFNRAAGGKRVHTKTYRRSKKTKKSRRSRK